MLQNFAAGGAAICALSREIGANLSVIDVGVDSETSISGVENCAVMRGTHDFVSQTAMSETQGVTAWNVGFSKAQKLARGGADLLVFGEMGIGNTTSAAAILALLCEAAPETVVGRGTGVNDDGLQTKIEVVRRAAQFHAGAKSPFEILCAVGGLEIAALAGAICASAVEKTPVLVDGFIVSVAALVAQKIAGEALGDYLFFAHKSAEAGHAFVLEQLGATGENAPLLDWGMRLGEASGVALALPLLRGAAAIFQMASFQDAGVSENL